MIEGPGHTRDHAFRKGTDFQSITAALSTGIGVVDQACIGSIYDRYLAPEPRTHMGRVVV